MGNRTPVNLTSQQWFSVFCTLIENDINHHTGQNFVDTRSAATNRCQMKRFFQFVTIAWHVDANSVLCTLIDNGKLANRILTLLPFVEKRHFTVSFSAVNFGNNYASHSRRETNMNKNNVIFVSRSLSWSTPTLSS